MIDSGNIKTAIKSICLKDNIYCDVFYCLGYVKRIGKQYLCKYLKEINDIEDKCGFYYCNYEIKDEN